MAALSQVESMTLRKANQYMNTVREEYKGRPNQTSAQCLSPSVYGVIFMLLHQASFHVSPPEKHPLTSACFRKTVFHVVSVLSPMYPRKTSFDITNFPKKLEVSTS